jgi:hypothetical protein
MVKFEYIQTNVWQSLSTSKKHCINHFTMQITVKVHSETMQINGKIDLLAVLT